MTTIHKTVLILMLCSAAGQTVSAQNGHFGQGKGAGRNGNHDGQVSEQICPDQTQTEPETERITALCRNNNLSPANIDRLLQSVRAAHAASLPDENIVLKIEEGLAKQVEPALIAKAAEARLDYLRQANDLLRSVRTGHRGGQSRLTGRIALVLEGGLPAGVIENTLQHSGRRGPGRLIRTIDAGAALHQAGLNAEQTQQFMSDCIDRDLNNTEISRALDFVLNEHTTGRDFQSIRQQLWGQPD